MNIRMALNESESFSYNKLYTQKNYFYSKPLVYTLVSVFCKKKTRLLCFTYFVFCFECDLFVFNDWPSITQKQTDIFPNKKYRIYFNRICFLCLLFSVKQIKKFSEKKNKQTKINHHPRAHSIIYTHRDTLFNYRQIYSFDRMLKMKYKFIH